MKIYWRELSNPRLIRQKGGLKNNFPLLRPERWNPGPPTGEIALEQAVGQSTRSNLLTIWYYVEYFKRNGGEITITIRNQDKKWIKIDQRLKKDWPHYILCTIKYDITK